MTLLNAADKLYLGTRLVDAVYAGETKVWPPAWSPASIPGLVAWIDATQAQFVDGQNITTYTEHSPAHRTFYSPAGAPAPPIYRIASVNGKPRFDFVGSGLRCDNVTLGAAGFTYVFMHRCTAINSYQMMMTCYTPGNGYEMRYEGNTFKTQLVCDYTNGGAVMTNQFVMTPGVDYVNTLRVTMSTRKAEHWVNGADRIEGNTHTTMPPSPLTVRVGFREDGYWFGGSVAEAMFYAGPVSDADLALLTTYLQTKWGL